MKKKVLSFVTALTLISSMSIPFISAEDGQITVDNELKVPIMKVVVPTDFSFAINTARIDDKGSSITSDDYYIINKSETPISVGIGAKVTAADSAVTFGTSASTVESGWSTTPKAVYFAAAVATAATPETPASAKIGGDQVKEYKLQYSSVDVKDSKNQTVLCYSTIAPTAVTDEFKELDKDAASHGTETNYTWTATSSDPTFANSISEIKYFDSTNYDSFVKARAKVGDSSKPSLLQEIVLNGSTYQSIPFALNKPATFKSVKVFTDATLTTSQEMNFSSLSATAADGNDLGDPDASTPKATDCDANVTSFRFVGLVNPDITWNEKSLSANIQYSINPISAEDFEKKPLVKDHLGLVGAQDATPATKVTFTQGAWTALATPFFGSYDKANGVLTLTNMDSSKTYTASITGGGNTNTEATFSTDRTKVTLNPGWMPLWEKIDIYEGTVESGTKVITVTRSQAITD